MTSLSSFQECFNLAACLWKTGALESSGDHHHVVWKITLLYILWIIRIWWLLKHLVLIFYSLNSYSALNQHTYLSELLYVPNSLLKQNETKSFFPHTKIFEVSKCPFYPFLEIYTDLIALVLWATERALTVHMQHDTVSERDNRIGLSTWPCPSQVTDL